MNGICARKNPIGYWQKFSFLSMLASMENNPRSFLHLSIRPAQTSDAARIVALIHQMGPGSDLTEDYIPHYLSGTERGILLACIDEEIAGLLSYSVRADLYHAGNCVLIEELVVDAGARGQGIGGKLLDALIEKAEGLGCKELSLAVMPDNEAAIRLYKQHGLVEEALYLERHFVNE
jgi:ribosomal protein S18 acetylase RimI-like enzyme